MKKKQKRNIWRVSHWKNIASLENDDVGGAGEAIVDNFCKNANITATINGIATKQVGGDEGDGTIYGKTVEIKTARLGTSNAATFQHELGEVPWKADFMLFLDIMPDKIFITLFKNFEEEFYKRSGTDSNEKCPRCFPTKSITWRKQKGAFKLDTSRNIDEAGVEKGTTIVFDKETTDYSRFKAYVDRIMSQ